jgi:hypothetical protein
VEYVCPNGHPVLPLRVVNCTRCQASVIYEPQARGMAFLAALHRAHAALDAAGGHTPQTLADRGRWPHSGD